MPEEHALLSASGAHRWLHCTRAPRLEETLPERTSDYAEEGRLAHALAELKVRKHFTVMKPSIFKKALAELQANPRYTPEMLGHAESYLEYIQGIVHSYKAKPHIAVEQRLDFSHIVPEGFGTGDCVTVGGNVLHIVDLKYGQGVPVDAENNPQMKLYALGALKAYSLLFDIEIICLSVFQPRLNSIKEWEISAEALVAWGEEIKPIAQAAYNGEGDFLPGDWCRFCRARELCRARAVFSQEPYEQYQGLKPPLISAEEAGSILERAGAIKAWISDLEEWALRELLIGGTVPGWKAVEGRSVRQFDNLDAAFADLQAAGYDEALLYERRPLTLAALEKQIGKKQFGDLMGAHIVTPPGKPTLAPESDNRQAITVKPTAEELFAS